MNKVYKISPLLLVFPLLASCGVSKPGFKKVGKEASYEDFLKAVTDEQKESSLLQVDKIGSGTLKTTSKSEVKITEKRGKKTMSTKKTSSSRESRYSYDADNSVMKLVSSGKVNESEKDKEGKSSRSSKSKEVTYVQGHTKDDMRYIIQVFKKVKEYSPLLEVGKGKSEKEPMKEFAYASMENSFSEGSKLLKNYNLASEEGKKDYKFYTNKKVYTIEFSSTEETPLNYGKKTETSLYKFQAIFGKDKFDIKVYKDIKTVVEYTNEYSEHVKGDIVETVAKSRTESSAKMKKTKVKPTSLKGYAEYGFDAK